MIKVVNLHKNYKWKVIKHNFLFLVICSNDKAIKSNSQQGTCTSWIESHIFNEWLMWMQLVDGKHEIL